VLSQFDFQYNNQDLIGHESANYTAISGMNIGVTTYAYNALNQLTASTNPERLYTYDDDGNMVSGYTPDGYAFTAEYDANEGMRSMEYSDGNIIRRYEFIYGYDGLLGQIKRDAGATLVEDLRIVRDGFMAIQDRDASNTVVNEYSWGLNRGGGIGGLLSIRQGGQDFDYLYDGEGNVSAVIDSTQAVVASYRYDSFGRLKVKIGIQSSTLRIRCRQGITVQGLLCAPVHFFLSAAQKKGPDSSTPMLLLFGHPVKSINFKEF
jgi:YD repeat-containing protein